MAIYVTSVTFQQPVKLCGNKKCVKPLIWFRTNRTPILQTFQCLFHKVDKLKSQIALSSNDPYRNSYGAVAGER